MTATTDNHELRALVASSRGYANLGVGAYLLEHSAEGEDAELCIVPATEADQLVIDTLAAMRQEGGTP